MTLPHYGALVLLFLGTTLGLGLPLARRLVVDPLERLCGALVLGAGLSFALAFLLFALGAPLRWFGLASFAGCIGLVAERRSLLEFWQDSGARGAALGWVMLAAWTQFLAMTVASYSGGTWSIDWIEHHQRAIFFREQWALDFRFIGNYALTSRPPLVNVVTAAYQAIVSPSFGCDQALLALWSSFVFLPAALFFRCAGGQSLGLAILVALLALNPSFLQNSTFPWTKLPAAFLVLAGVYFVLRGLAQPADRRPFGLGVFTLTAAVLAHYSAAPFCVVLAAWWLIARLRRREARYLVGEVAVGLVGGLPLAALWFGWALAHYGVAGTMLSNSTATGLAEAGRGHLAIAWGNIWATLIPHPLRGVDLATLHQSDRLGWFRDYFFMIVQVNLPALLGSGGGLALGLTLWRNRDRPSAPGSLLSRFAVATAIIACFVLGVAVVGAPDIWGLAHICLQPLAILGLSILAAWIRSIGSLGMLFLGLGILWDAVVNVGLHYWLQSRSPPPGWLEVPDLPTAFERFGHAAYNAGLKHVGGMRFLGDTLPPLVGAAVPLIVLIAAGCAWWRFNRRVQPAT